MSYTTKYATISRILGSLLLKYASIQKFVYLRNVMAGIQAIRGMKDLLPGEIELWQKFESSLSGLMARYGYQEIRMPVVEKTELFKRGIGEVTDIVEKEMYTFEDRNGDSLTLRPEGTAQCVRAGLEHGLLHNQTPRLWYYGPMFRHERPQKGRYRQFYQLGVEAFGMDTPDIDVEQIIMMDDLWKAWGIREDIELKINSLGTPECRARYRDALVAYFEQNKEQLDEDSQRRLSTNPLRILDSKNPDMQTLNNNAPKLIDYLSEDAAKHFEQVKAYLDKAGISYTIDTKLVRGLDYYTLTVYEWVTESLGAQGTVCGGGRYDELVKLIGGKATPAVGFAMGIERLISLITLKQTHEIDSLDAYLVILGEKAQENGLAIAQQLRQALPQLRLLMHCGSASLKSQFKKADKSGAKMAFVLGDDECDSQSLTVKYLREDKPQQTVKVSELTNLLSEYK